jgi:predicted GIY-YIG superfamily endonuclease
VASLQHRCFFVLYKAFTDRAPRLTPLRRLRRRGSPGVVRTLHDPDPGAFVERYRHAGHYTGWAADLEQRLAEHAAGQGARLLAVVKAAGISWTLAQTRTGTHSGERALKRRAGGAALTAVRRAAASGRRTLGRRGAAR